MTQVMISLPFKQNPLPLLGLSPFMEGEMDSLCSHSETSSTALEVSIEASSALTMPSDQHDTSPSHSQKIVRKRKGGNK